MAAGRGWFKLDADYFDNPKVIGLSTGAIVLHVGLMCHCAQQLNDGAINARMVAHLTRDRLPLGRRSRVTAYDELLDRGLIREVDDGIELNGWLDMNPQLERSVVEKNRAATRERVRRHRAEM